MKPVPVTKAVFPVAGLGARFLRATKSMPKELLPIIDRPIIHYAVAAGITGLVSVTGRIKRAIRVHFGANLETQPELELMCCSTSISTALRAVSTTEQLS